MNGDSEDMLCKISLLKRMEDMFKLGNEKKDDLLLLRRSDDGWSVRTNAKFFFERKHIHKVILNAPSPCSIPASVWLVSLFSFCY